MSLAMYRWPGGSAAGIATRDFTGSLRITTALAGPANELQGFDRRHRQRNRTGEDGYPARLCLGSPKKRERTARSIESYWMDFELDKPWKALNSLEPCPDVPIGIKIYVAFRGTGNIAVQRNIGDCRVIAGKPSSLFKFTLDHCEQGMRAIDCGLGIDLGTEQGHESRASGTLDELTGGNR